MIGCSISRIHLTQIWAPSIYLQLGFEPRLTSAVLIAFPSAIFIGFEPNWSRVNTACIPVCHCKTLFSAAGRFYASCYSGFPFYSWPFLSVSHYLGTPEANRTPPSGFVDQSLENHQRGYKFTVKLASLLFRWQEASVATGRELGAEQENRTPCAQLGRLLKTPVSIRLAPHMCLAGAVLYLPFNQDSFTEILGTENWPVFPWCQHCRISHVQECGCHATEPLAM